MRPNKRLNTYAVTILAKDGLSNMLLWAEMPRDVHNRILTELGPVTVLKLELVKSAGLISPHLTPRPAVMKNRKESKYTKYLDGQEWKLKQGVDFESLNTIRSSLYAMGREKGLKIMSTVRDGLLVVQARPLGANDLATWEGGVRLYES